MVDPSVGPSLNNVWLSRNLAIALRAGRSVLTVVGSKEEQTAVLQQLVNDHSGE